MLNFLSLDFNLPYLIIAVSYAMMAAAYLYIAATH